MRVIQNLEINILASNFEGTVSGCVHDLLKNAHETGTCVQADQLYKAIEADLHPETKNRLKEGLTEHHSEEDATYMLNHRDRLLSSYKQIMTDHPARTYSFKMR